jgi:hypothetical protein
MAGTINLALTQQFDVNGDPLSGGRLFFFAASTTTPQDSFQDVGLTLEHPNPLILDSYGRVPMFYLDDGSIKVRLEDDSGLTIFAADNLLVIGPSSGGGGGGGGVDVTTVLATGDIKARFGTGSLTGFCRCNGNTVGSGASSASELADATAEALFKYLWTTPLDIFTSGGGASTKTSANNDWLANKRMALPDLRGRAIVGLDDMGASRAFRLTDTYWGADASTDPTILGDAGGSEQEVLQEANMAPHSHGGTTDDDGAHIHTGTTLGQSQTHTHPTGSGGAFVRNAGGTTPAGSAANNWGTDNNTGVNSVDHTHGFTISSSGSHPHNFTTDNGSGTSTPVRTALPSMTMTFYIKL